MLKEDYEQLLGSADQSPYASSRRTGSKNNEARQDKPTKNVQYSMVQNDKYGRLNIGRQSFGPGGGFDNRSLIMHCESFDSLPPSSYFQNASNRQVSFSDTSSVLTLKFDADSTAVDKVDLIKNEESASDQKIRINLGLLTSETAVDESGKLVLSERERAVSDVSKADLLWELKFGAKLKDLKECVDEFSQNYGHQFKNGYLHSNLNSKKNPLIIEKEKDEMCEGISNDSQNVKVNAYQRTCEYVDSYEDNVLKCNGKVEDTAENSVPCYSVGENSNQGCVGYSQGNKERFVNGDCTTGELGGEIERVGNPEEFASIEIASGHGEVETGKHPPSSDVFQGLCSTKQIDIHDHGCDRSEVQELIKVQDKSSLHSRGGSHMNMNESSSSEANILHESATQNGYLSENIVANEDQIPHLSDNILNVSEDHGCANIAKTAGVYVESQESDRPEGTEPKTVDSNTPDVSVPEGAIAFEDPALTPEKDIIEDDDDFVEISPSVVSSLTLNIDRELLKTDETAQPDAGYCSMGKSTANNSQQLESKEKNDSVLQGNAGKESDHTDTNENYVSR